VTTGQSHGRRMPTPYGCYRDAARAVVARHGTGNRPFGFRTGWRSWTSSAPTSSVILPSPLTTAVVGAGQTTIMHPSLRWRITLTIIGLGVAGLFIDHFWRCSGIPLTREEALRRATTQLKYLNRKNTLGDKLPALIEERYDSTQQTWIFTFRHGDCTVDIVTDRCHGTDVGGVSQGCK
jgi:hypothetical protein